MTLARVIAHVFVSSLDVEKSNQCRFVAPGLRRSSMPLGRRGRPGAGDHVFQVGLQWVDVLWFLPFGGQIFEDVVFAEQATALVATNDGVKEGAVGGVLRVLALDA